jgi:hypothetical protein
MTKYLSTQGKPDPQGQFRTLGAFDRLTMVENGLEMTK